MLKAILIDCSPPQTGKEDAELRLAEAESLIKTYGGVVVIKKIQKRQVPDYRTFIGKGKLEEIIEESKHTDANILIINNELKPHQTYNINEKLRKDAEEQRKKISEGPVKSRKNFKPAMQAWDRIDIILKIFQKHATTREARLEIELASIRHMGPRIYGMGMQLTRQGGGIGTKGVGETNLEFMRRHLDKAEHRIKQELETYKKVRKLHRSSRQRKNLKTVGIIGYTNAGKTSLLNALTHKGSYTADKLFATLDTRVGKLYFGNNHLDREKNGSSPDFILISDTIGFIQDLPTTLIKSFQSTLEETIEADLLLHVIDINDPKMLPKIKVVNEILGQIDAFHKPTIYVFNKVDRLNKKELAILTESLSQTFQKFNPCFVSVYSGEGIQELKEKIHEQYS